MLHYICCWRSAYGRLVPDEHKGQAIQSLCPPSAAVLALKLGLSQRLLLGSWMLLTHVYTVSHKKWSQLIFVCNFVKNQRMLMQFSLLELTMNDTCDGMNFTHLT